MKKNKVGQQTPLKTLHTWADVTVVKSTCCSSRRPGCSSQLQSWIVDNYPKTSPTSSFSFHRQLHSCVTPMHVHIHIYKDVKVIKSKYFKTDYKVIKRIWSWLKNRQIWTEYNWDSENHISKVSWFSTRYQDHAWSKNSPFSKL